jgi:plasmid stabilization system protein ParE
VKRRHVRFTQRAERQADRERVWWIENRDHPDVFVSELADAIRILELMPGIGAAHVEAGVPGLRRLYLHKLTAHLYYTFDDDLVIIRALWGARRDRGPDLRS